MWLGAVAALAERKQEDRVQAHRHESYHCQQVKKTADEFPLSGGHKFGQKVYNKGKQRASDWA